MLCFIILCFSASISQSVSTTLPASQGGGSGLAGSIDGGPRRGCRCFVRLAACESSSVKKGLGNIPQTPALWRQSCVIQESF